MAVMVVEGRKVKSVPNAYQVIKLVIITTIMIKKNTGTWVKIGDLKSIHVT